MDGAIDNALVIAADIKGIRTVSQSASWLSSNDSQNLSPGAIALFGNLRRLTWEVFESRWKSWRRRSHNSAQRLTLDDCVSTTKSIFSRPCQPIAITIATTNAPSTKYPSLGEHRAVCLFCTDLERGIRCVRPSDRILRAINQRRRSTIRRFSGRQRA